MRLPIISITALLTLISTVTISDFPLIQNPKSKIPNDSVLAQTPDIQLEESLGIGNGSNNANKVSIFETQASSYTELRSKIVVETDTETRGRRDAPEMNVLRMNATGYYTHLIQTLIAQNKTDAALEIAERDRARAFLELLSNDSSSSRMGQSIALNQTIAPPTIEDIKRIAKEHQATLVSYSIINDVIPVQGKHKSQESEVLIWVISPRGEIAFRRVDLKPLLQQKSSLSEVIISTRESIGLRSGGIVPTAQKEQAKTNQEKGLLTAPKGLEVNTPREDHKTEGLQQLYQLLIQPIADLLPSDPNARVVFIPQGELFLVPFPTLQDTSGKYLIEQHSILTAPSIQVLDLTRKQRERIGTGEYLIVGNPSMPSVAPSSGQPPQQLPNLPGAEREAKAIAQLLNTTAITGEDATESAILEKMPQARIIHLATNTIVDSDRGMGSAIALAPDSPTSGTPQGEATRGDGLLTAEEIMNLKLNAELVVLSGCDSGLGRITGDGVIGLSRSFIAAGASSVIVSLGYVPDESTAFLMTEFYRNLQQSPDKAQALRNAMLATRKKYPDPVDWGAFTLIGEAE
ncbi:MAG: CHAT domain-containing protein [Cyanobacteriota bacterium]